MSRFSSRPSCHVDERNTYDVELPETHELNLIYIPTEQNLYINIKWREKKKWLRGIGNCEAVKRYRRDEMNPLSVAVNAL